MDEEARSKLDSLSHDETIERLQKGDYSSPQEFAALMVRQLGLNAHAFLDNQPREQEEV